jgi:hypothetical protein
MSGYADDSSAVVAGVVDDMLGDARVVVSPEQIASEATATRGFLEPQTRRRAGSGGGGVAALANEVRDLGLPTREFPNWAENHQAVTDHASIEARTRSMFAPPNTPAARERRLLREPAAAPAVSAAPAVKPSGQSADAFVEGLSPAQREALEASLLDLRAAEWQQTDVELTDDDTSVEFDDYAFDDWLTTPDEAVEQGEAA